jgi:phenylacetate-coenzyme A ligase PaaK-like adenylate-forming protein
LAEKFVSPRQIDRGALMQAMTWFAQARGQDMRGVPADLDAQYWRTVPFTRKPDLRVQLRPYPESGDWITSLSSSGTTANPVVSPWSEADERVAATTVHAVHALCPSIEGARCAVIAPSPGLAVAYSMLRQIELSGGVPLLIPPGDPEAVLGSLVDEGIDIVFTLPLVASRIGEYATATHGAPPAAVRLLICGGDVLSPARQAMLTRMWDAVVLNMFGCSELFGPTAGPGEHGGPLVWRCEPVAVELIDPATLSPCAIGDRGVMVLTTLWPKASPLLRYWTDDVVQLVDNDSAAETFAFDYIGRPPSMLNVAGKPVPLRDIDEALLSGGWCTSEWCVRQTPNAVVIEAEMPQRQPAVLRCVREALRDKVGIDVELVPREPGSLGRAVPKFTVLHRQ